MKLEKIDMSNYTDNDNSDNLNVKKEFEYKFDIREEFKSNF